jgi:hypothetical protein
MTSQPRLANLLSALSQVSDLGMGLEPAAALRVCLFATSLGRDLDLDDKTLSDAYYTALLQHSGCTAHAYETALALGDDVTTNRVGFQTNFAAPREWCARRAGPVQQADRPPARRVATDC